MLYDSNLTSNNGVIAKTLDRILQNFMRCKLLGGHKFYIH